MKPDYSVPTLTEVESLPWNGLNVVSTFSGGGGSCLGFRMAGYRTLWASEFIPLAAETYQLNHPNVHLDTRDIRQVHPDDILSRVPSGEEVHVLEGSPPCAAFSLAGKRTKGWGQVKKYSQAEQRVDDLFEEFMRLVAGVQPCVFVMENVKGLVGGASKGVLLDTLATMRAIGYRVEVKVLNAQWLGVPQSRQRVIFQGVRKDLGMNPVWPKPLPYQYTIRDAIPADMLRHAQGVPFPNHIFGKTYKGETLVSARAGELEDDSTARVQYVYGHGHANFLQRGQPISLDRPAPTILATADSVEKHLRTNWATYRRRLSMKELRLLCSFPSDFRLAGESSIRQWERLGRAVPPLMMRAIAEVIRDRVFA